jgi:hypothetical protein
MEPIDIWRSAQLMVKQHGRQGGAGNCSAVGV